MYQKEDFLIISFILVSAFNIVCLTLDNLYAATPGSTGWIIFRKVQSPKPKSLTTVCAVRGDLSGVLYNSSVLATIDRKEIFTMAELGLTEDKTAGIIYAHPFRESAISIGVLNYDAGKITLYWIENGQEKERPVTAQSDILGIISYGRALTSKLKAGITAKFATSNIAETATANAYAVDLGVLYYFTNKLIISVAAQNFGITSKFVNKSEKLPASIWGGLGYTDNLTKEFYFTASVDVPYIIDESRITPSMGIEIGKPPISIFTGYRLNVEENVFSIGLNMTLSNFDLSYAYIPSKWLNSTHRLSLGIKF